MKFNKVAAVILTEISLLSIYWMINANGMLPKVGEVRTAEGGNESAEGTNPKDISAITNNARFVSDGSVNSSVSQISSDFQKDISGAGINTIKNLPANVQDAWVKKGPNGKGFIIYTDKDTKLQGIMGSDGKILLKPSCRHLFSAMKVFGWPEFPDYEEDPLYCSNNPENFVGGDTEGFVVDLSSVAITQEKGHIPMDMNGTTGWVYDSDADQVVKSFDIAQPLSEGLNAIMNMPTLNYGFCDQDGRMVIPTFFKYAHNFIEGRALVGVCADGSDSDCYDDAVWGFIDEEGNEIIPLEFTDGFDFEGGYAAVGNFKDGDCYIYDLNGNLVVDDPSFKRIEPVSEDTFLVERSDSKWAVLKLTPFNPSKGTKNILRTIDQLKTDLGLSKKLIPAEYIEDSSYSDGSYATDCPLRSYLRKGDSAKVRDDVETGVRIHQDYGKNTPVLMAQGSEVQAAPRDAEGKINKMYIEDGPFCRDDINWFKVNYIGYEGYIAEANNSGDYYLEKIY